MWRVFAVSSRYYFGLSLWIIYAAVAKLLIDRPVSIVSGLANDLVDGVAGGFASDTAGGLWALNWNHCGVASMFVMIAWSLWREDGKTRVVPPVLL